MTQMPLCLIVPLARRTDPATSHAAVNKAASVAPSHRNIIVDALRTHGPMTVYGIEHVTGLLAHKIGKRLKECERLNLAELTGEEISGCREWRAI